MPAPHGSDNVVGICLPDEWAWFLVMLLNEAVDDGLKVDDGVEDAVFQAPSGQPAKKPSTALSHEREVGTKWST